MYARQNYRGKQGGNKRLFFVRRRRYRIFAVGFSRVITRRRLSEKRDRIYRLYAEKSRPSRAFVKSGETKSIHIYQPSAHYFGDCPPDRVLPVSRRVKDLQRSFFRNGGNGNGKRLSRPLQHLQYFKDGSQTLHFTKRQKRFLLLF